MTGIQTEYFLGIYFLVISLTLAQEGNGRSKLVIEWVKFIFGVLLLVLAILGKTFI